MDQKPIKESLGKYESLIEHDENEQLLCTIRRHPIGLLWVYLTGILIALAIAGVGLYVSAWLSDESVIGNSFAGQIAATVGVVLAVVVLFFAYVGGYVYTNSVILVTSDKVAQILYNNLIDRKISQLSLGDLQDVTVEQRGLLARIFHYGTLTIETAGEQNNFSFSYTPYPHRCAEDIVSARENSIKKYGN